MTIGLIEGINWGICAGVPRHTATKARARSSPGGGAANEQTIELEKAAPGCDLDGRRDACC